MVEFFFSGVLTGYDPPRGSGQEFSISRAGRAGSCQESFIRNLTGRISQVILIRPDPTRPDPTSEA